MRNSHSISCWTLAATVLLVPASAFGQTTIGQSATNTGQRQQQSTGNAQANACDRLIERLRSMPLDQRPIGLRQARQYRQSGDAQACQQSLQKVDQRAQSGSRSGETAGGQITVQRAAPSVTVSRGQPEITIKQQRPVVTVEIPPPTVTVRMPEPDVNVVETQQEPNVRFSQQAVRPKVNYETAEPQVNVRQSDKSPEVNYETADRSDATSSSRSGNESAAAGASQAASQSRLSVEQLTDMSLYTERG
jgi:hypothetical protein